MRIRDLLPLQARNALRPAYQRAGRLKRHVSRFVRTSRFWPKPASWYALRSRIEDVQDSHQLYGIAASEFGILQIEEEIVPFLDYVASHSPTVVGEIGIKHGGNSFLFSRRLITAKRLLCMDLALHNTDRIAFLSRQSQSLDFFEGNSYCPRTVDRVRRQLGSDRFDFLFIDGDHEYAGVAADFLAYYDMVKPGGLMAFHDIVPDEFARTGRRPVGSDCYGGGVYRLWQQLRDAFPHREFVQSWEQTGFGIGVLTKVSDSPLRKDLIESILRDGRQPETTHAV